MHDTRILKEAIDATCRLGHRITSSYEAIRKFNYILSPGGRLRGRVVRADHLCAAGESKVAPRRIVGARLFRAFIGSCSHQIALLNQRIDLRSRSVVLFCERGIGRTRFSIRKEYPPTQ